MDQKLKTELAEIEEEIENNEHEMQVILDRQEQLRLQRQVIISKLKALDESVNKACDLDSTDLPWSKKLEESLKSVFKLEKLRHNQLQSMNATLNGSDCMVIMPTGGGKSLCYQLTAVISNGITLVVSPLISLMEDQVMSLKNLGVRAEMLSSGTDKKTVNEILKSMNEPSTKLKLLYVTPERLSKSKRFMSKLEKMYELGLFARLAVDEVHCCSQWGHDFRKDYKILGIFKRQFPKVPIIGLTATATTRVTIDVQEMLNIQNCKTFRSSFNRHNLFYKVLPKPSAQKEASEDLANLIRTYKGKSGIVYCLTIKEAEDMSKELQKFEINAMPYHAQLSAELRSRIHRLWVSNKCQVVVATIAFGMGIDKPDVRFVIHNSLTKSVENYYQESGRAGRDDARADCIMFYRSGDFFRQSCMVFTETTGLKHLYIMGEYCINQSRCRRSILAQYFGERWDSSGCNNMCDICLQQSSNKQVSLKDVDITKHCKDIYQILDAAALSDQKLTALKLIEAWMGKKVTGFVMPKITSAKFSQVICERIIIHLLIEDYLKEHFHFTPYNTISYIIKGSKSARVTDSSASILIKLKSSTSSSTTTQNKTVSSAKAVEVKNLKKPSVSLPKKEKVSTTENHMAENHHIKKLVPKKKIEEVVIESEDSDLDFGEYNSKKSKKRLKMDFDSD